MGQLVLYEASQVSPRAQGLCDLGDNNVLKVLLGHPKKSLVLLHFIGDF